MNVCGSYACTCKGGCGDAAQSSAPIFHCAGREPGTGSARVDNADNNIPVSVNNAASEDRETKQRNSAMRIGSVQRFGQKNRRACIFLERVAYKTGSLVCTQCAIVVVHDLKRQLAATEFTGFHFDRLQQTPSDAFSTKCR